MKARTEGESGLDAELLRNYEDYLENEAQLSKGTREVYLREAGFLLSHLRSAGLDISTITLADLDSYLHSRDASLDARTVSRINSSLRSLFTYLVKDGIRKDNIALMLEKPKMDEYLPHALSIDEVDSILDEMKRQADEDILFVRDYTFFELIYSCGLRISEAVNLKVSSYNRDERTLIVFGKRSKERLVFVGQIASDALDRYLAEVRPVLASANRRRARRTAKDRDSTDAMFRCMP